MGVDMGGRQLTWKRLFTGATRDARTFESSIEAPTGNRWSLIRTMAMPRSCMSRTPRQAAGPVSRGRGLPGAGCSSDQHAELLRLIGTLVDNVDEGGIVEPQRRVSCRSSRCRESSTKTCNRAALHSASCAHKMLDTESGLEPTANSFRP
jgi:hypothetical protein